MTDALAVYLSNSSCSTRADEPMLIHVTLDKAQDTFIRAALHSTRTPPVPVDTISIKREEWQTMDTAPLNKYVILNISPLNYPVIAANDGNGWMTRTGAFYGVDTATLWMPLPAPPKVASLDAVLSEGE